MKTLKLLFLFAVLAFGSIAHAQTTTTTTTLSTAVGSSTANVVTVASATGVTARTTALYVDRELMVVESVSGTNVTVRRGADGTTATTHASGAKVYVGPLGNGPFIHDNHFGSCTAANEGYLPQVNVQAGVINDCLNSFWERFVIGDRVVASFVQGGTAADALDTIFFIADHGYYRVADIDAVWATAESTGSMDIMVEKLTGTTACGSGTDVMASVIAATGTANTTNNATLTATIADRDLAAGNRLCVDLTATPNEVVNMVVNVGLRIN